MEDTENADVVHLPLRENLFTVFIDNIPEDKDSRWLRNLFSRDGKVMDEYIPSKVRRASKSRYGFVRYKSMEEAVAAINKWNTFKVGNYELGVKLAYNQGKPSGKERRFLLKGDEQGREATKEKVAIPHPFHLSICLNDLSIDYVSITQESGIHRCRARISLALAFEHWGQEIATTAVKYAVTRGFEEFKDLVRIEGIVEVDCEGSQRVLEKVGFRNEGLLRKYAFNKGEIRDVYVFSILSTDPISA